VLDEPMLQYATKVIDGAPKPVMLSVFTLSSHYPYYIPPKYAGKFPKGELEIHESIGYTDYSLQQFFKTAETKPWFKNTIFVLTADHTQKSVHPEFYYSMLGYYRVPLIFYIPGLDMQKLGAAKDRITQQIDIMPSILDLLGETLPDRLLVGQSVFDNAKTGRAFNYTAVGYWYLEPKIGLQLIRPNTVVPFVHDGTYNRKDVPLDPRFDDATLNLKAVVHYMNEGLTGNSLYRWRESL
jgi:phosphoglycerol transferase MdoB-like AlkP superfamily enzyme